MLLIFVFLLYMNVCISKYSEKICVNCKNYLPVKNNLPDSYGLCSLFNKIKLNDKKIVVDYEFAYECRKNKNLCGVNGTFYEEIEKDHVFVFDDAMKKMIEDYHNYLKSYKE